MQSTRLWTRRLTWLMSAILIWFGLGTSVFSFSIGNVMAGAIELAIVLVLIGILVEGRLPRLLDGRPVPAMAFLYGSILVLLLVYDAIRDLRINDVTLLGSPYLPGIVSLVSDIGSLILAVALTWELVKLWRQ